MKPGEEGRTIAAAHSSWFENEKGKYIEGKYPTIGQVFIGLSEGDEVVWYVRETDGGYSDYTYYVTDSLEVEPQERGYLYPESGREALLYMCTDFGTSKRRFLVKMQMRNTELEVNETELLNW